MREHAAAWGSRRRALLVSVGGRRVTHWQRGGHLNILNVLFRIVKHTEGQVACETSLYQDRLINGIV